MKDLDLLLDIIKQLRDQRPKWQNFKLRVYGEVVRADGATAYAQHIRRRIVDEELRDVIELEGRYEPSDLRRIYRGADLLVLTSESETGPLVVQEAMMYGTPFVATDVGSVRYFSSGFGGVEAGIVIVRTEDRGHVIREFTEAIKFVAENPDRAKSMGTQGRKIALAEFSALKMAEAHLALFSDLRSRSDEPLKLAVFGLPFDRDGVLIFYLNLFNEIRRIRPDTCIEMHTPSALVATSGGKPDPAVLQTLDNWRIHRMNDDFRPGSPPENLISEHVVPALRTFLRAIKQIDLGNRFGPAAEAPKPSQPEVALLESVGNALVVLSNFFGQHNAYRQVVDSAAVRGVFEEVFPELDRSESAGFHETLTHDRLGLTPLLMRVDQNDGIIYFPNVSQYVFAGIVDKIKSRNSHLVIGMHSMLLQQYFQHLHQGENDISSVLSYLDVTRSLSTKTRCILQQYVGLIGYLVFHYADRIIHYAPETKVWIEKHYLVPREKSALIRIGIPDQVARRKLRELAIKMVTPSLQKRLPRRP